MPKKSKKEKKEKKEKKAKDGKDGDARPSWFGGFCACSQVCTPLAKEKIETMEKADQPKPKEKKEKKKRKQLKKPGVETQEDSQETTAPSTHANGEDDDSGETCTSYATESAFSRQSSRQGTARSTAESSRASRSARRGSRGAALTATDAASKGVDGSVRVLNLADLRGQDIPLHNISKGSNNRFSRADNRDNCGDLSARSGRSEGSQSAKSCRSDARSEGGGSVASVSVRKYMGYLSEPRSPAEVKKMVKDFVRQMVKGREMSVLRADGALRPVLCGLARSLDVFRIKSGEQVRKVKLVNVERVVFGAPEDLADLETPLDESCATIELEEGECISFKFAERKAAELFTLCMQLFIDGQKSR